MWEDAYEEMLIARGADKIAIPEGILDCILDRLDELTDLHALKERVAAILQRLAKGGHYRRIIYDHRAGTYVFTARDGTLTAITPIALDTLFTPPERPKRTPYFRWAR